MSDNKNKVVAFAVNALIRNAGDPELIIVTSLENELFPKELVVISK